MNGQQSAKSNCDPELIYLRRGFSLSRKERKILILVSLRERSFCSTNGKYLKSK